MAKKSFYDKLEDIPEADRADYELVNGKWVLQLDGAHPVQLKNTELLGEKTTRESQHQTALSQKDSEIQRLTGEVAAAKQTSLPADHVAVPREKYQTYQQFETLGKFDEVKTKVEEHGTLKEKEAANARKTLLASVAEAVGIKATDTFVSLAEAEKLADSLESREIDDGKGNKVKHWFIKTKDEQGADKSEAMTDFVKNSKVYAPLLTVQVAEKKGVKIPSNGTGEPPQDKSAADSYISSMYKRPDKQAAGSTAS